VQRHPELRWLVSVGLVVAVTVTIASAVSGVFRTDPELPATNPDQLVAQVKAAHDAGCSHWVHNGKRAL
jgi:uncharacterized protein (DUF849 family)